ncbi:MAG: hypothetical protein F6J93_34895 [Oscillatoria sp. SIO1A7]|nr:hypothetical protein [Oscillatoria sp. SIO1A7]
MRLLGNITSGIETLSLHPTPYTLHPTPYTLHPRSVSQIQGVFPLPKTSERVKC